MKIAIGCDHAGFGLKEILVKYLEEKENEVLDMGCYSEQSVDYPVYAKKVTAAVKSGEAEVGILVCGTGIGMSIVANKTKGIRCALCSDTFSARMTREHNNTNVLALGARVIGSELAKDIVDIFLKGKFLGAESHTRRLKMVEEIEKEN